MRASDMAPSKYLRAGDLDGEDLTVTIKSLKEEKVGTGAQSDEKWVLYFKGHEKGLVLNKTNITTIAKLLGDETDDWAGKQITLFPTEVDFQGKQVEAIRVRSRLPKGKSKTESSRTEPAAVADESDDDVPF